MKTLRIFISGTVQGMIFRKYLEEQAKEIGIRGFVRQMEDGRVEILAEGIDDRVTKMLELCKRGTVHAHVRNVEVENFNHQGFKEFKILKI
ncbi:acylphosphatase [Candidatus Pacearchaeota archaeon]|nr:acylphosphatase [Candidatus Pacearchaeota archaeon]